MLTDILASFSSFTWIIFVVGGIFSSLWFLERLAGIYSEELREWLKFIAYFGFVIGVLVLIVTAINLIGPYLSTPISGKQIGWDVTVVGFILGATLCLRPIKDMKWAALISLAVGCIAMITVWVLFPSQVGPTLIGLILGFMFVFYMSVKFVEDIYATLGKILTSPPVAVGIGILAIIQGLLLLFGSSIITLISF
jgi:hypothetical protein